MRLRLLIAIACVALAGCWGGDEGSEAPTRDLETGPAETGTEETPEPMDEEVTLVPMRPQTLRRCRRFPEIADICPLLGPEGRFGPGSGAYQAFSRDPSPRVYGAIFSLQQGGEHPGRPELDRPPATVHVVVAATPPFRRALPPRVKLQDGLMEQRRRGLVSLGRARWGGHEEGILLLAPPFPRGGLQANHLILSWDAGSKSVSLHGWEPFTEVPEVLRAVVESIPAE
jgi:hypothetical protein